MVYDSRKEIDLIKLEKAASKGVMQAQEEKGLLVNPANASPTAPKTKPWANLWKKKKQNNMDYLMEAETGNLQGMVDLLDPAK